MVAKQVNQILAKYSDGIIIFIFPILLVFLNSNWIFTPATDFLPDPWFYLGYFRYFSAYTSTSPSNTHYFVERLTWNIPGYYIYKIFPTLLANYVLHLSVCYIALFSLYGTLQMLFNRRTALLSTLLLGSYPWFLRAVGWDYVDGVGIAQMLLLIYLLTVASRSRQWRLYTFLAGIIHASLLATNLFWVGFAPSWVVYFLLINYPISRIKAWELFGKAIYFILGNLTLLVIVGIFYHSVSGSYNFFKNGLAFSIARSRSEVIIQSAINLYGHMPPYWHVIPILVALGAIWQLRSKNVETIIYRYPFLAITSLFVFAYGWLIFAHFYGWRYLIVFLYSSFAIPATFLLLGALLATIVNYFSEKYFTILVVVAILILAAPYLLVVIFPFSENWQGNTFLILILSLIFLVNISLPVSNKKAIILPLLIAFSVLSFLGGINSYVFLPDQLKGQRNFAAIIDASNTIDSFYPNHRYKDFRLWFREDENYNTFFNLSALYLYPFGSAIDDLASGKKHPAVLSFPETDKLKDGDNIVVITSNSNMNEVIAEANRALAYRHATLILQELKEIREGPLQFTLYFSKIKTITDK